MADWYTAAQVTVNNGETTVRVVSAEPINIINEHDSLMIGDYTGRDILRAYTEDVTLDQIIELVEPWDKPTQTLQPAKVQPTAVNFNSSVEVLKDVNESIFSRLSSYILFGEQETGTVTFSAIGVGNSDVTIKSIPQYKIELDELTDQAGSAVSTFDELDDQLNGAGGLVEVADSIDSTLQGYVTSASDDAIKSQEYAVNPYDQNVTNTTDKSSLHHATDSLSAKVLAEVAKNDTITLKNDVTILKSQTEDVYDLAYALSDTAVDTEISAGVYSLKHYLAKTQEAAATAQAAVSSVTASLYFVGQWNASSNTAPPPPTIVDGVPQGNPMYKVTVSGVIDGVDYEPNDNIIWDSQNSTHDGTNWTLEKWFKVDNSESVVSVNGKQGVVVLNIADIAGLQSAIDAATSLANSKVAQSEYDAHVSLMNVELNKMRTNLNCKLWGFII